MKIGRHSIIELDDGLKYLMLNAQKIGDRNFCLLFAPVIPDEPVHIRVGELSISDDGHAQVMLYEGDDYKDLLLQLLEPQK